MSYFRLAFEMDEIAGPSCVACGASSVRFVTNCVTYHYSVLGIALAGLVYTKDARQVVFYMGPMGAANQVLPKFDPLCYMLIESLVYIVSVGLFLSEIPLIPLQAFFEV